MDNQKPQSFAVLTPGLNSERTGLVRGLRPRKAKAKAFVKTDATPTKGRSKTPSAKHPPYLPYSIQSLHV